MTTANTLVDSGVWYCLEHHGVGNEDDDYCDREDMDATAQCSPVPLLYWSADE